MSCIDASPPAVPARLHARIGVDFSYDVRFCRHLFAPRNRLLADFFGKCADGSSPVRLFCFVDDGVVRGHPQLCSGIRAYMEKHRESVELVEDPRVLAGGEQAKNGLETVHCVTALARKAKLCRKSCILVVGGGALLDAVGFAAAMIHRGIPLVRVPSTVLSQNDSGVGVKNGVNAGGAKNFLGTFAPPAAVFNDFELLGSLSRRDWIAGTAEAFKVAAIKDETFLFWLLENCRRFPERDDVVMAHLIRRCAQLHVEHITEAGDPFEFGRARPLDFGHWAGHHLESLSRHELRHGEAVAIGMAIDLLYAEARDLLAEGEARRLIRAFAEAGLPVWHDALTRTDKRGRRLVFEGIEAFREHLGGCLHVTLPGPLGTLQEVTRLDEAVLESCLVTLERLAGRHPSGRE